MSSASKSVTVGFEEVFQYVEVEEAESHSTMVAERGINYARREAAMLRLGCMVMLAVVVSAPAQSSDPCAEWSKVPIPAADLPAPQEVIALRHCDALKLYYDSNPEQRQLARKCAFVHAGISRDGSVASKYGEAAEFQANAILLSVYFNGYGVKRNLDIAKRFACQGAWPGDVEGGKRSVENLGKSPVQPCAGDGRDYDGMYTNWACVEYFEARTNRRLKEEQARAIAGVDPSMRPAFDALQADWLKFRAALIRRQGKDCGTSLCTLNVRWEESSLTRQWTEILRAIDSNGAAPSAGFRVDWFRPLAKELEREDLSYPYGPTLDGLYLRYREAWVKFGALRWPAVRADQWRAWLTKERIDGFEAAAPPIAAGSR